MNIDLLQKHADKQGVPVNLLLRILEEEQERVHLFLRRNCVALLQELIEETRTQNGAPAADQLREG